MDPFSIRKGLFVLDLPSCLVLAGEGLAGTEAQAVERTIHALRLNDDDYLVQRRCDLICAFIEGSVTMTYLHDMNPFVFDEITRQGLWPSIGTIFRRR